MRVTLFIIIHSIKKKTIKYDLDHLEGSQLEILYTALLEGQD